MTSHLQPGFSHRPSFDGNAISFCNQCSATVAETRKTDDLDRVERTHACDPRTLEYWLDIAKIVANQRPS